VRSGWWGESWCLISDKGVAGTAGGVGAHSNGLEQGLVCHSQSRAKMFVAGSIGSREPGVAQSQTQAPKYFVA